MNASLKAAAAMFALCCAAAQSQPKSEPRSPLAELEQKISALTTRVTILESRVPYPFAALNCNSGGFDEFLLGSSGLVLLASCVKVETFLEGHRLTLNIGNPHSFQFSGVKGTLQYGSHEFEFDRKVEVSTVEPVKAASWTRIIVTINPSKPEDLRVLRLRLSATSAGPGN